MCLLVTYTHMEILSGFGKLCEIKQDVFHDLVISLNVISVASLK